MSRKEYFSSLYTSLMATAGLAIGIGNVWRFPYMMGSYGGSAFLVLFICCIVFISLPALMAEWALARQTRKGTIGVFMATFGPFYGRLVGYSLLFCLTIAGSYYLVVIGNVFYSGYFSTIHGFSAETTPAFQAGMENPTLQLLIAVVILVASIFIVHRGVKRGIEFLSNLFVPFFFLVSFYLVIRVLNLPGASSHLSVFLEVDFRKIGFTEIFAAIGQAYFSIGLGATLTLIYGSYLKDEIRLPKLAIMTCVTDTGAALLAALYLIPALLVFGMDLTSGPTLLFETLPKLFEIIPGGRLFGSLMLVSLVFVTFLSYVAVIESVIGGILDDSEKVSFTKSQLLFTMFIIQVILLVPFTFYPQLVGIADLIFGSAGLMIGGCLALLSLTWIVKKEKTIQQIFGGGESTLYTIYFVWIKWVVPAILILVLGGTLYEVIGQFTN